MEPKVPLPLVGLGNDDLTLLNRDLHHEAEDVGIEEMAVQADTAFLITLVV